MNFEDLVTKISPKLKAITKRLNRRMAFFDEDDLYQEAMIYLWEEFGKGSLSDKTESFILQGCFFFLRNYIRVAYKRIDSQSVSINTVLNGEGDTLEEAFFAEDPERQFKFIIVDVLVEDILNCLTGREKEIFLFSLEDLTTREIGKKLGISHVMVGKLIKKIRIKCDRFRKEAFR